jgi:RNA polymerase sigma-B factor
VSLDGPPGAGAFDVATAGPAVDDAIADRDVLARALAGLSDRERLIVRLRFVEERSQSQIGVVIGVSQMQVSRLLAGILRRLREDLAVTAA